MRGWILHNKSLSIPGPSTYSINRLVEAAQAQGVDVKVFQPEFFELIVSRTDQKSILIQGEHHPLPDFVLARTGSGTTYFALAILRQLERLGVYVCNSSQSIETVKDKLHIHQVLAQSKLSTPKTMLLKFPIDINLVKKEIGFPLVIKNITGTEGRGVHLCETPRQFHDIMELMYSFNKNMNIIIQEFIETSKGIDLRVFVVGGKVIGCMKRTAQDDMFKANYSQGASVEPFALTPEIEQLAIETARLLHLDIAGVDLLFDKDGYCVIEANSSPHFEGMEKSVGKTIAEQIVSFVMEKKTSMK